MTEKSKIILESEKDINDKFWQQGDNFLKLTIEKVETLEFNTLRSVLLKWEKYTKSKLTWVDVRKLKKDEL